jgi:hypothetical protein
MKSHARSLALAVTVAAMLTTASPSWLAAAAHAHDPGLSSSVVVLSKDRATATLRIHDADLADARSLAASEAVVIRSGHDTIPPEHADKVVDGEGEAVFSLSFRVPREAVLEIHVPLLGRLPRGHKHLIEVRAEGGGLVTSSMIGTASPRVVLPPP